MFYGSVYGLLWWTYPHLKKNVYSAVVGECFINTKGKAIDSIV